jgi:hypothetical protein
MMMLWAKYSIPDDWDKLIWMYNGFHCCTATACHQGYFFWLANSHDTTVTSWHRYSSSNSVSLLCVLSGVGMTKIRTHYFLLTYWCDIISIFLSVVAWLTTNLFAYTTKEHKFPWDLSWYHLLFTGGEVSRQYT